MPARAARPSSRSICVALSSALVMMEPQLRSRTIRPQRNVPRFPVMVYCDRYPAGTDHHQPAAQRHRRDQGAPATRRSRSWSAPAFSRFLSVRDNGPVFPIWKICLNRSSRPRNRARAPGLGLHDLVGDRSGFRRLTAHNASDEGGKGAVFELSCHAGSRPQGGPRLAADSMRYWPMSHVKDSRCRRRAGYAAVDQPVAGPFGFDTKPMPAPTRR